MIIWPLQIYKIFMNLKQSSKPKISIKFSYPDNFEFDRTWM